MANMHRCKVEARGWVGDLVGVWAAGETSQESGAGFDSVSPMFAMLGESAPERDGSFSDLEVACMRLAVERLAQLHPELYGALLARYRPRQAAMVGLAADDDLLQQALIKVGDWVDQLVDKG